MAQDIVREIAIDRKDTNLCLSVHFDGGPIRVEMFKLGKIIGGNTESERRTFTFTADPFFRSRANYVASGLVLTGDGTLGIDRLHFAAQFTNVKETGTASYRVELSSARRGVSLFDNADTVANGETVNVVYYIGDL